MKIKSLLIAALSVLMVAPLSAQSERDQNWTKDYQPYPYYFFGVQGGAQTTFTDYSFDKLIMPTGAVSLGAMFTPVVGTRLNVNGWRDKGGFKAIDKTYYYNHTTYDVDLLINLSNILWTKNYHKLNLFLIGGIGLNYGWHNYDAVALSESGAISEPYVWKSRFFHNFRAGGMLEYNLGKHLAANIEVTANNIGDRYNSKINNHNDWQLNVLAGLTFKFGFKAKAPAPVVLPPEPVVVEEPVVIEEPVKEPEPVVVEEPKPEPKVLQEKTENIFFDLNKSSLRADQKEKVSDIAAWLKEHPSANVTLNGYADVQTGNSKINRRLSEERVATVKNELVSKYGIEENRIISSEAHGDEVQPFKVNENNRVVMLKAKETE